MKRVQRKPYLAWVLVVAFVLLPTVSVRAQKSDVMGEVQFDGKTNVEKTSGVWVDGQYVGYLKELQGSKKVLLLPGEHTIPGAVEAVGDLAEVSRAIVACGQIARPLVQPVLGIVLVGVVVAVPVGH